MAHSERVENDLYKNIPNMEKQQLFRSGVEYFLKQEGCKKLVVILYKIKH